MLWKWRVPIAATEWWEHFYILLVWVEPSGAKLGHLIRIEDALEEGQRHEQHCWEESGLFSLQWDAVGHPWVESQAMKKAEQCVLSVSIQQKYSKLGSIVRDSDKCGKTMVRNKGMITTEFRIVILGLKGMRWAGLIGFERMEIQGGGISFYFQYASCNLY